MYVVYDPEGGVPVEVHQALQATMEKLQQRFTSLMQEKADLRERIEELEHRCIQLSGETDTIGETTFTVFTNSLLPQRDIAELPVRWKKHFTNFKIIVVTMFCVSLSRRVHSSVPESARHHEAETPREGAVHQHAGPGQGGDEGTVKIF